MRGTALVLLSLLGAFLLSDFPRNRATLWLVVPAVVALVGTADTIRCLQPRWNFYHGGVVLCVYMDLMVLAAIFFFLVYPYLPGISAF